VTAPAPIGLPAVELTATTAGWAEAGAAAVTCGADGIIVDDDGGGRTRVAPVPPRAVVDQTGAGFVPSLTEALARLAQAAAGTTPSTPGGRP
jgi:sugar/nucleoside kinase (ribokinase family)